MNDAVEEEDAIKKYIDTESYKTFDVPKTPLTESLGSTIYGIERERFWIFLNQVILEHKRTYRNRKPYHGHNLQFNERVIPYDFLTEILGSFVNNKTIGKGKHRKITEKGLLAKIIEAGILTIVRYGGHNKDNPSLSHSTIYAINPDILKNPAVKSVTLKNRNCINSRAKAVELRAKPFSSIDRKILCKEHSTLCFDIDSDTFLKKHLKDCEESAIRKGSDLSDPVKYQEWLEALKIRVSKIDEINSQENSDKWLTCSVDTFGKRLHHTLGFIPSSARQYARVRGRGSKLVPLFEIDLRNCQAYLQALCAIRDGVEDDDFNRDLKNDLYKQYAQHRGFGSRAIAKEAVFKALFGQSDSSELKAMSEFYPDMAKYLTAEKTKQIEFFKKEMGDKYAPYKNNSIKAQRAETKWARQVWNKLAQKRIRFIPVHDSVIVFGPKKQSYALDASQDVENIMVETMASQWTEEIKYSGLKPNFKTTWFMDFVEG